MGVYWRGIICDITLFLHSFVNGTCGWGIGAAYGEEQEKSGERTGKE